MILKRMMTSFLRNAQARDTKRKNPRGRETYIYVYVKSLTPFIPLISFIPPENIRKLSGFLMFSRDKERDHQAGNCMF